MGEMVKFVLCLRAKARLSLGLFSHAFLILPAFAAAILGSAPAVAACNQAGSSVSCTGTSFNYDSGAQNGITVTVQSGATVIGTDPTFTAIKISQLFPNAPNTLTNNGTILPSIVGPLGGPISTPLSVATACTTPP